MLLSEMKLDNTMHMFKELQMEWTLKINITGNNKDKPWEKKWPEKEEKKLPNSLENIDKLKSKMLD